MHPVPHACRVCASPERSKATQVIMATSDRHHEYSLYLDHMSQPSRACAIFVRSTGLQGAVKEVPVLIHKGDTRSKAHLARNPLGKVPVLLASDGAPSTSSSSSLFSEPFKLPESCAILSYLSTIYPSQVPDHWFPRSCPRARARVEAALHWYQASVRAGCMRLVFHKVIAERLGVPSNPHIAAEGHDLTRAAVSQLDSVWLTGPGPFLAGSSRPSVADLIVACELEQLTMLNKKAHGVDMGELLEPHPRVRTWMAAVAAATAPHYEQVHATLRKVAAAGGGSSSPAQATPGSRL